ncbi:hypothetical protein PsYK624_020910 [Phanerochaete sordida]|uniref:Uncharacterized protein n=1 Tax=Phanerochaete sordida TaxID=48140 RepID=A0A9P3G0K8_9APHY|nr:hypothetical protein PsYK624_020910 [Phanerochaete sordida]
MSSEPPPTYSQNIAGDVNAEARLDDPQILIVPPSGGLSFQKGYLGADGERAAIEGEVLVKGATHGSWKKVTVALRSVERSAGVEVDLSSQEMVLYSSEGGGTTAPSPSYLFSLPLPPDTPQCIHSPQSALEHSLTATLHPSDSTNSPISSTILVHVRRYASHPDVLQVMPETQKITDPTPVEVQVPRTTFRAREPVPLYISIPPPRRELILDEGLRLRNVRAELVRVVKLHPKDIPELPQQEQPHASTSAPDLKSSDTSTSYALDMRQFIGTPGGGEVIALSGTSCRVHPTRTLQVRLVLQPREHDSPFISHEISGDGPGPADVAHDSSTSCASISQSTVLHDISFSIVVHATFMNMRSHTERVSTITIPIVVIPPAAPLPEVEESLATEYHKKHDRPPTRTVRQEESDVPLYSEGEPGPSYSAAPPPFEERDAPPPFFSESVASGSRLPTFLESETEIYVPAEQDPTMSPPPPPSELVFNGEGVLFGFSPSEQFDGYAEPERAGTPPPSMEMARSDPDVTNLALLDERSALNALELALEHHHDSSGENAVLPPPPPPMDDPSDPPPSIDSAFRSPSVHPGQPPLVHPTVAVMQSSAGVNDPPSPGVSHEHAPPPYGVPDGHASDTDQENVARPPPYVDLVPARE